MRRPSRSCGRYVQTAAWAHRRLAGRAGVRLALLPGEYRIIPNGVDVQRFHPAWRRWRSIAMASSTSSTWAARAAQGRQVPAARDPAHPRALPQHALHHWRAMAHCARASRRWSRRPAGAMSSSWAGAGGEAARALRRGARLLRAEHGRREPGHRAAGGDGERAGGGRVGYPRLPLGHSQSGGWAVGATEEARGAGLGDLHLLGSEEERARFAAAGRRRADEFSWRRVGARVEEYYGEILAQRASLRHPFALPQVATTPGDLQSSVA